MCGAIFRSFGISSPWLESVLVVPVSGSVTHYKKARSESNSNTSVYLPVNLLDHHVGLCENQVFRPIFSSSTLSRCTPSKL